MNWFTKIFGKEKRMARRRRSRKSTRRIHKSARWKVKCGKSTRSYHRKKSAARRAKPARKGCRVVRA